MCLQSCYGPRISQPTPASNRAMAHAVIRPDAALLNGMRRQGVLQRQCQARATRGFIHHSSSPHAAHSPLPSHRQHHPLGATSPAPASLTRAQTPTTAARVRTYRAQAVRAHNGSRPPPSSAAAPVRRSGQQGVQHRYDSSGSGSGPGTTVITFRLRFQATYGQRIRVVGNCDQLGMWDHMHGAEMTWSDGHLWTASVGLPRDTVLEYKFVVLESDGRTPAEWQSGNNAVLPLLVRPPLLPLGSLCFRARTVILPFIHQPFL